MTKVFVHLAKMQKRNKQIYFLYNTKEIKFETFDDEKIVVVDNMNSHLKVEYIAVENFLLVNISMELDKLSFTLNKCYMRI